MLRERLGQLEVEHARSSGRLAGLKVALAEEETRLERARRELTAIPIRDSVKHVSARTLGVFGLIVLVAAGGLLLFWLGEAVDDIDRELELTVIDSDRADLSLQDECSVSIVEDDAHETEKCAAAVRCGGHEVYRGRGRCDVFFDEALLEYWDHGRQGEPRLLLVELEHRAILRDAESIVVFQVQ
jgi:uncharacterized coiled-coil protein SlyX